MQCLQKGLLGSVSIRISCQIHIARVLFTLLLPGSPAVNTSHRPRKLSFTPLDKTVLVHAVPTNIAEHNRFAGPSKRLITNRAIPLQIPLLSPGSRTRDLVKPGAHAVTGQNVIIDRGSVKQKQIVQLGRQERLLPDTGIARRQLEDAQHDEENVLAGVASEEIRAGAGGAEVESHAVHISCGAQHK